MTVVEFLPKLRDWTSLSRPMYKELATAIVAAIQRGELPTGTRLPPERDLADSLGVSRSVIVSAYDELRSQGAVDRREGSGTFVRTSPLPLTRIHDVGTATLKYNGYRGLAEGHRKPIDLSMGALGAPPEVTTAFASLREDITGDSHYFQSHGYSPAGLQELRVGLAREYSAAGLHTVPDQILVTTGAQQAIFLIAVACLSPGSPVVIEDPTYPGALDALGAVGARLTHLPTDRDGIQTDRLRDTVVQTKARLLYVASTFHNPTGALLSMERRRVISSIATELKLITIDDTALSDLALIDEAPLPLLAALEPEAPIFTVGSLSKTFWGGLRIGWVRGPERLIADLGRLKGALDRGTPVLDQLVAVELLGYRQQVAKRRRMELQPRLKALVESLAAQLPSWCWQEPAGGTSLLVRLPAGNASDFAEAAYLAGVIVVPGSVFSVARHLDDQLRLTFVVAPDELQEGVQRLATAWKEYTSRPHIRPSGSGAVV